MIEKIYFGISVLHDNLSNHVSFIGSYNGKSVQFVN